MPQVIIRAKEAAALTGNTYGAGRLLLARIRKKFQKATGSYVSIGEFCAYTGLPRVEVAKALKTV